MIFGETKDQSKGSVALRISQKIETIFRSSYKERRADALAPGAEEGRGKHRNATGSRKQALIRGCPNGATHYP